MPGRSALVVLTGCLVACSYDVRLGALGTDVVDLDAPIEPGSAGEVTVRLLVRSDQDRHLISPLIYGTVERTGFGTHGQTLMRHGGPIWTAYNWENNASNSGRLGGYQNTDQLSSSERPGEAIRSDLLEAESQRAALVLPVPILDYVAADKGPPGDVRNLNPDYLAQRFRQNFPGDPPISDALPDPTDATVSQAEFVAWVRRTAPEVRVLFSMGDEVDLVRADHVEIHPTPLTYTELCNRNLAYALAVKSVWPEAETLGFASYGWSGWTQLEDPMSREVAADADGKGEFLSWCLAEMQAADVSGGVRLIDYVDLHWISEAQGDYVRVASVDTSQGAAARVQAPRSLWDETYVEDSWITTYNSYGPIAVIPGIRRRIEAEYPGTRLMIGKWDFGGHQDISGAIAVADTLGIFGRHGVDAGAMFVSDGPFVWSGLYVYRNFDGADGRFGDVSIGATSTDPEATSVYASVDQADPARVVVVAINKATSDTLVGVELAHPVEFSAARVYALRPTSPDIQPTGTVRTVARNAFRLTLPASSVSVLVPVE